MTTTCQHCGSPVAWAAPAGAFAGGWIGLDPEDGLADDGWGTLCVAAPDHAHQPGARRVARITRTPQWDHAKLIERPGWTAWLAGPGGFARKVTRTRRALVEWCAELGYEVVP